MPRRPSRPKAPKGYEVAVLRLGHKVAELRAAKGMTQEGLAERTGISRNQIQNIEANRNNTLDPKTGLHGPSNPRLETIFRLAEALDVTPSSLIED